MDISDTLAPDSTQLDAIDLRGGPRTFTITKVSRGGEEGRPVELTLAEFPRVWRPGKSMRRVLVACWGPDASAYVGRRVMLFCDESVTFGKERPGGTRIRALSHIDGPKTVPLLLSQGRSGTYKVEPLPEQTTADRIASLGAEWKATTDPDRRAAIEAEVAKLKQPVTAEDSFGPVGGGSE